MVKRLRIARLCTQWGRALVVAAAALLGSQTAQAQVDAYTLAASSGTFTPLTGGTNVPDIEDDDEISGVLPIGFTFAYDGVSYTQVKASSNGWLTFNTTTTDNNRANELNAGPASIRPLVAPLWDDVDGEVGTASYLTTGTAPNRVFTMEWLNWQWNWQATGATISFQVKLYEGTNRVEFIYRQETGSVTSPSASIGLAGGTVGSFLSLNGTSANPAASSSTETANIATLPATGQVYAFTPPVLTGCSTPRGLSVTNVGLNSATLNWSALSGNGTFTVEYGPAGFTPGSGAPGVVLRTGVVGNSLNISSLLPLTNYQFYVTQTCGGTLGNSARSNAGSFFTLNDDCSTAVPLSVSTGNICQTRTVFSMSGATGSTGVPAPACASYQGGDVWFTVVVPANGALTLQTDSVGGSAVTDTGMEIYSGTCGSLTSIECDDDDGAGLFSFIDRTGLTPGSTIYVRVWQYGTSAPTGRVAICVRSITPPPPPPNDECATAITIVSSPTCANPINGYITGATQSLPVACGSVAQANDVWYKFVAVSTAQNLLFTPQFAAAIDVLQGASCGALTSISCGTVTSGSATPRTITNLVVGQTYYIRIYTTDASVPVSQGVFTLCVTPAPGSCATPTAPAAASITSSGATLSWAGTTAAGESYTVLYGPRNNVNTPINNITATSTTLTNLQPNTEYCFIVTKNCGPQLGVSTSTAETCFRTLIAVPTNDEPCGAVSLVVNSSGQLPYTVGTNAGSTTSTPPGLVLPACGPALAPRDVWYRVTMPANQTLLNVELSGAPAGMVRLFTAASCSTSFNLVQCRSASGANVGVGNQVFTGLTAGTTYYIAISGYGTNDTQGNFIIGNIGLSNRKPLAGGELTVFPNPVQGGTLTLHLTGAGSAPTGQAVLINALGQVVRKQSVSIHNGAAEQQLTTTGLSRGLYTLRLEVAGAALTRTVVIE